MTEPAEEFLGQRASAERAGDTRKLGTLLTDTGGSYQGHPVPEAVRATLVLVGHAGEWKLAALNMSFIVGTPWAPPIPGSAPALASGRSA